MTKAFKEEFGPAVVAKGPASIVLDNCKKKKKIPQKHKLLYSQQIQAKYALTHKSNRGGSLLNPNNAHRNAARISRVGADTKQLKIAFAMELAPDGELRESNIEANKMLLEQNPMVSWRP